MTTPRGFLEVIAGIDQRPCLVAVGEVALVSKLAPGNRDEKTLILMRFGERVTVATEYEAIVDRLALSVGTEEGK